MEQTAFAKAVLGVGSALSLVSLGGHPARAEEPCPVKALWVGGPTLVFRFGPIRIVTDPVLGKGPSASRMFDPNSGTPDSVHARLLRLPEVDLDPADLVLISHDHADHLGEIVLARLKDRRFVLPLVQAETLRGRGAADVLGLPWRSSHTVHREGYSVRITAVPAQHSERPERLALLGDVNGYWLEFRHGAYRRTVYWTGDSFPMPAEISADLRHPDLLVAHLGGVGAEGPLGQVTMGARQALSFARAVEPKAVLPIHHSTFSDYRGPIETFERAAASQPWRLERVAEGEELVLQ
ncbi:MBL fold metallo-hydrolase [Sphingomonas xanthus]|uniref:MBL fold metallo-hydrolase n=1 Tax=Sphingomonas xanthus TaxID=2594473 RepID=A0A516IP60_9SPHN|nr:MBL fold metallo-hydrolase [Sphingomonas xanthus]QDP18703.1 MBL fold metallo-hydrolase [Sphingomonas xanthus]